LETLNTYYEDDTELEWFIKTNYATLFNSNNRAVLVQVFSGVCDGNFLLAVSKKITELVPHAHVIGATSSGGIMNGEVSGLKIVLSFSVFHHSNVKTAFVAKDNMNDYDLGRSIASQLNYPNAKILILMGTGLTIDASQMLKGVQSINHQLPVAGGNAADNFVHRNGFVFCQNEITTCGVAGVVLIGKRLIVNRYWYLGWRPIGKEMTITKAKGLRVYTIDNIPAFDVLRKYLGLAEDDDLSGITEFPLVALRSGMLILRRPYTHYNDGSVGFVGDLFEGEYIRFSFANMDAILAEAENLVQDIKRHPVESIFVYSCSGRRGFLQEFAHVETLPLQEVAPTSGFFTYGEYFHSDETNLLLNYTMTALALSESAGNRTAASSQKTTVSLNKNNQGGVLHTDNTAEKNMGVLKTLTHLVNAVTDELNERTLELENASIELWDIKKRLLEGELERIARIDLVGQMAAAIGHEIRNPLTTVRGFLQMLNKGNISTKQSKQSEYYELMISELDRANSIITEYLSLAKNKALKISLNNLNTILYKLAPLIQAETFTQTKNIDIIYNLGNIPDTMVDENEVRQLVLNLTKNALEATPEFGKVIVATYKKGASVVLEIKDEGPGIPKEILAKIGTPFITTKETGTGLGLAVCYSIAARHKAVMHVKSGGSGTIIHVRFPAK
jgi:signal transduction histidine kinase